MRIFGQGGGFPDDASRQRRHRSDPEAFRKGRRVGQIVRGRLVAPADGGLAWVSVDGHTLLARLEHVPTGGELLFRITSLTPELVLQDITPITPGGADPVRALAALTEARSHLETLLDGLLAFPSLPPLDLTEARRFFGRILAAQPDVRTAWDLAQDRAQQISALLPPDQGRLRYAPWIFPGLGQSELLTRRIPAGQGGPGSEVNLFGRLREQGRLAVHMTWQPGQVRYRLLLEHPQTADSLIASLARVRFGRAELVPLCLSAGQLPGDLAGGYVAKLLAARPRPFTGLRLQV
jgi:hypothetical protein